jgi:antirestriction protein
VTGVLIKQKDILKQGLAMNSKLGHYIVNGKQFSNKLDAILHANLTKAEVSWDFNKDILDKVQWEKEPPGSIDMIYAERARQIREKYDYVIIMASGGADSTNVVHSFLDNGIHVDEIIAGAPISGLKNLDINANDTSAENTVAETMLAQLPFMHKISQKYPNIKLTIHDYFEDILELKTDEWIYEACGHWIHHSAATRHSLDKFKHLKDLAEQGKTIGVVYGIDKPIIVRAETGYIYLMIPDTVVNIVTPHFKERYTNVESVFFYYAVDFPELMVKQVHELSRWLFKPENAKMRDTILYDKAKPQSFNDSADKHSTWQRTIVPCIYPAIFPDFSKVWQADKQGFGFNGGNQIDAWVYKLHKSHRFVEMVDSDLNRFLKQVDPKYLMTIDGNLGWKGFVNYWKIGHESQFMPIDYNTINIATPT